jgi:3-hydroxyacyl-[acyl-carrier protein] dehydratase/trans-2-decenoyl-[acyl-carrier protein] isomerase
MLSYHQFRERSAFSRSELLAFAHGTLIADAPAELQSRLPLPPMLMLDRITRIERHGRRGVIVAERDVRLDDWFFQCHFRGDPVQPGCLGVDAVWQLLGFYCCWNGALGAGRALGCGEILFEGQIRPHDRCVRYEVRVRRYADLPASGAAIAVGDARVLVDDECIYTLEHAKVGVFRHIAYGDYPRPSRHSRGGLMTRDTTPARSSA